MPKAKYHTQKEREQLPLISGHFTDREGLQPAYYPDPAVQYVKYERLKQKLDEKDLNDKIKLEVQNQLWLASKKEINGRNQDANISRSTSMSHKEAKDSF